MTEISRSGRRIAVHDLTPDAPADAPVVLLCHAAPGSASFDPDPDTTVAAGIRLISVDRPGYGGSEPVRGGFATVASAADDPRLFTDDEWTPPGRLIPRTRRPPPPERDRGGRRHVWAAATSPPPVRCS